MARRGRKPNYAQSAAYHPWGARQGRLPLVLEGIIQLLPESGALITDSELQRWLDGFRAAAHLVYRVENDAATEEKAE